ncbi:MAG: ATP-dependent RNA helicase RhlE [Rhodocyclaceae bacterium]|nr:MAG: DEAD/DEAH box helicase [Rhodocyclaceae bacterium]MBV6407792.1 ATP-dependent RNA helicase RhlE [Rhodocyclaceae bacterium]MCK6385618.1 DEAD/DEAH box helicase [Rhodocyclaceae bacterium]
MAFAQLGLNPFVVKAVEASGYTQPTAVQAQAVPATLEGTDLLVSSQTGSGKTAAFMLPCLHRLTEPSKLPGRGPRVLVLVPTRELAQQVTKAADTYGKFLKRLRTVAVVGGAPFHVQAKLLSQPVDVVVATPGRLIDHIERGRIDFSRLETLILDEADRMLDMGFIDDIEAIVARTPATRQTLLFSATLEGVVGRLASRVTKNARRIEIETAPELKAKIAQRIHFADDFLHKSRLLDHLLRDVDLSQAVVFTSTKKSADDLAVQLRGEGFAAEALHGDMSQRDRNRTLQGLRQGRTRVLVATDVAARGIDVPGISHVINFDLPRQAEDYVHRIGRTGRAGREGIAISLAAHFEKRQIRDIERYTAQSIRVGVIPGLEPKARPARPEGFGDKRRANAPRPAGGYGKPETGRGRRAGHEKKPGGFRAGSRPAAGTRRS